MLIWINGAFGAGKTQTAHELHRRLPTSHVADPELLGFAMHKMLPASDRGDFQDLPQWRSSVVDTLQQAEMHYDGPVIVPMTVTRDDYFDEMVGGLVRRHITVRHFTLSATAETLRRRLRRRAAFLAGALLGRDESWAVQQIERCVTALAADRFATHVPTDDVGIDDVVETISGLAGLTLAAPRLSSTRYQVRRLAVGIRHIRI